MMNFENIKNVWWIKKFVEVYGEKSVKKNILSTAIICSLLLANILAPTNIVRLEGVLIKGTAPRDTLLKLLMHMFISQSKILNV